MKLKVLLLSILVGIPLLNKAVTFTVVNDTGKDIQMDSYWIAKRFFVLALLKAGESRLYDSGDKNLETIVWTTEGNPLDRSKSACAKYSTRNLNVLAHEKDGVFRLSPDGAYTFTFPSGFKGQSKSPRTSCT